MAQLDYVIYYAPLFNTLQPIDVQALIDQVRPGTTRPDPARCCAGAAGRPVRGVPLTQARRAGRVLLHRGQALAHRN